MQEYKPTQADLDRFFAHKRKEYEWAKSIGSKAIQKAILEGCALIRKHYKYVPTEPEQLKLF